jgi:hypothetical protein
MKNIGKYEFMLIWWIGIPLYIIAITLVMVLASIKGSMCF